MWSPLEVLGLGVVQLEEQYQGIVAREFSPKKYRRLLKDLRNVGEGGNEFPEVVAGTRRRGAGSRRTSSWMVVSTSVRGKTGRMKPKRCGPNVLLRTQIDSDLHDIVHEVDQLS